MNTEKTLQKLLDPWVDIRRWLLENATFTDERATIPMHMVWGYCTQRTAGCGGKYAFHMERDVSDIARSLGISQVW